MRVLCRPEATAFRRRSANCTAPARSRRRDRMMKAGRNMMKTAIMVAK
jgi:hypothetical protein